MAKTALIFGGTRYFGKTLVEALLSQGVEVTVATRGLAADPFGEKVRRIKVDREDPKALGGALGGAGWDVVYDQICYSSTDARSACEALRGRAGHYVFTSSQSAYATSGLQKEEHFDPCKHPLRMGGRADFDYGEGKRQAEAAFFQLAAFPVTAVRFPFVLGPDDYTGRLKFHVERVQQGRTIVAPNLESLTSIVCSSEAGAFLAWLFESRLAGPVNACSPRPIAFGRLIALIERGVGRKAIVVPQGQPEDQSPYGEETSNYMDAAKAQAAGFSFSDWEIWLPGLIQAAAPGA